MIRRRDTASGERGMDWLPRAVTAGFFATVLMSVVFLTAYWIATLIGSPGAQAPIFLRWSWALAHNVLTRGVETSLPLAALLHFLAGIAWAVVYAALAEPRLSGPGWRRGTIFSLAPWLLSLVVFLPLLGGGIFGLALGAGPLPIIGNLVLHLVYGASLGQFYLPESERSLSERGEATSEGERFILAQAGRTMALGIVLGLVIGALLGLLIALAFAPGFGPLLALLFGALVGSALGALVGAFWGLSPQSQ